TVLVRDVAVLVLVGLVIRQIYRPGADLVRRRGVDDPAGGVFDRAPDAFPDRWPQRLRPAGTSIDLKETDDARRDSPVPA
ncbi:MAG TPA: hypothetical protein PLK19_16835, partial [Mycobacterium sp.]|nr:hypothetical protein [Mycobacterium sp.]